MRVSLRSRIHAAMNLDPEGAGIVSLNPRILHTEYKQKMVSVVKDRSLDDKLETLSQKLITILEQR